MTRRRKVVFALIAFGIGMSIAMIGLLGADLYVHHRAERSAGLNRWGYRGPVLGRKQSGEVRVAMFGGSTMFGYGVLWNEALPAQLEQIVQQREDGHAIHTINLGYNNEGAYALVPTMQDFAWLDFDVVIFYIGYNDLMGDGGPNRALYRHESPVFRLTGYYPILPLYLNEKALMLRTGGQLEAAYKNESAANKTVFRPGLAARTSATAMEAVSTVIGAVGNSLDDVAPASAATVAPSNAGCSPPWVAYCDSVFRAVTYARAHGMTVVVASQPLGVGADFLGKQVSQQKALADLMARRFGNDAGTVYVNLGPAVDVSNPSYSFDQMHLGAAGNRIVAQALVEPTLKMVAQHR